MASKEEYLQLTEKVSKLKERRAVLVSEEEQKATERTELIAELTAAGIDPTKPKEEIERLEKEIQDEYDQAKGLVDQFEVDLLNSTKNPNPADVLEASGVEVPSEVRAQLEEEVHSSNRDLD